LGGAGVILGGLFFFSKIAEVAGNPFKADLQKYVNAPNYSGNVAFIEEFHRDFKGTVDILTKDDEKIFIFIDDLDRAEVPKAAELMQGLNMMISDSPRLIFIIGMDREKVAAGVAAKYKDLLPFLNPEYGPLNTPDGLRQARNYGYSFLEKFVQLSFQIPRASAIFTMDFINSLSSTDRQTNDLPPVQYRSVLEITQGKDAELFRDVVFALAPFFDHNPRRIKQFVNTFRLKAHIAGNTGLFAREVAAAVANAAEETPTLTIPQLGKFIALTMLWPRLLDDLIDTPNMLKYSDAGTYLNLSDQWKNNGQFMLLLKLVPEKQPHDQWDMQEVNVGPLVQTSPSYKGNTPATEAPASDAPVNANTAPDTEPNAGSQYSESSGSFDNQRYSEFKTGSTTTTTTRPPRDDIQQ
jgi:hypothetical protein